MSYRYERRRRGRGCLVWLVVAIWAILLLTLAYRFWLRPQVSQLIGQQLGAQVRSNIGGRIGQQLGHEIQQGAEGALPTVIAGLPSGEIVVTEVEANDYLATHADSLKPIDGATVRFIPNEAQADIQAMGMNSRIRSGLAVQNGRIIAVNPQLEGPLSQFISIIDLTASLEQQINDQLVAQNRRATDVRIEQGQLVVVVE